MPWLAFGTLVHELRDGEVIVGTASEATWRVATADLMPRHFVVDVKGGKATLRPFSTDVVVVVNGRQLSSAQALRDGDVIDAGSGRFTYSTDAPRTAAPPPADDAPAFLIDPHAKVAYRVTGRSAGIGRDASNAVVVRDPAASRFHAEVRHEAGGFALHPRGSAGTVVNKRRLDAPCLLSEGDVIEIAYTFLRFTRQPLPAGITIAAGQPRANDELSRRPTLSSGGTSNRAIESPAPPRSTRTLALLLLAVLVAVAWLIWR